MGFGFTGVIRDAPTYLAGNPALPNVIKILEKWQSSKWSTVSIITNIILPSLAFG